MVNIDLYSGQFWWFVAIALMLLVPARDPRLRRWTFAALNLGFLLLHTRPGQTSSILYVAGGVLVCWIFVQALARRGIGAVAAATGGAAVLALFLLHKLPHEGGRWGLARVESILAVTGFSYVALRLVELGRAVRDGRHRPPDLASTVNYLLPFHMLAAGPIQAYDDFVAQPAVPPPPTTRQAIASLERIAAGLFKKFVLANYIDRMFQTGFHAHGAYPLLEMQFNYLWIYLDFSAYSDVAVGLGGLMGVATPENFNRPYLARNVIEFWERWHISLSQFIRRNLFFPIQLALMRWTDGTRPLMAASLAFAVSFLLCGLWHSVSLPWLAWGAFQAAGLIACNIYRFALTRRLGRKGVQNYLANRWIRLSAIFLTFEFQAIAMAISVYPIQELISWTGSRS
jgi:D-alanyl-lipoteichoic acid acyltransferase DltB (MBOAT superfamily)